MCPKDLPQANEEELQQDDKAVNDTDYHRLDEQVYIYCFSGSFDVLCKSCCFGIFFHDLSVSHI